MTPLSKVNCQRTEGEKKKKRDKTNNKSNDARVERGSEGTK